MMSMNKYLIEGVYKWVCDNLETPVIAVNIHKSNRLKVPSLRANSEGIIVLDISNSAVNNLVINTTGIEFQGLSNGKLVDVYIPIESVVSVFSFESKQGLQLPDISNSSQNETSSPMLRLVQ